MDRRREGIAIWEDCRGYKNGLSGFFPNEVTSLVTVIGRAVPFLFFLLGLVTLLLFLLFLGLLLFAEGYEVTFVNLAVSRLLPDGDDCRRSWDNEFVWQLTGTSLFGVAWSVFKCPAVAVDTSTYWRGHLSGLWF